MFARRLRRSLVSLASNAIGVTRSGHSIYRCIIHLAKCSPRHEAHSVMTTYLHTCRALALPALCAFQGMALASDPVARAQALISPSGSGQIIQDSVSIGQARASVNTGIRSASAESSIGGLMFTTASASDGGFSQLTSGSASGRMSFRLEGPSNVTLSGKLVTEARGSGTVSTELGNRGSMALASFNYDFQTVSDWERGSVQWISQAGIPSVNKSSGGAIVGTATVTPTYKMSLETAFGTVSFTPDEQDWLHWGLPKPQASLYPIQSISMMSDTHADAMTAIKRAMDLHGLYNGDYDLSKTKVSIGVDVDYSFDASASVDLNMRAGRSNVLLYSISSHSNSTSGGMSVALAEGMAGVPGPGTSLAAMRFVVAPGTQANLDNFKLYVDGLETPIPIMMSVPEPEGWALPLAGILSIVLATKRRATGGPAK